MPRVKKMAAVATTLTAAQMPECVRWVLTLPTAGAIVGEQRTEWPFPVSIELDGSVRFNLPATRVVQPMPEEPAPF